ncbi:MAG: hypothetical protein HC771_17460 [Synechococcales cyanobacterium CRU_2_2]|nr:hypothetical protein [Synechococcales cyanobacterium CRU_2_2]
MAQVKGVGFHCYSVGLSRLITVSLNSENRYIARKEIGEYLIDASSFIEKELDEEGNILSTIWAWTKGIAGFLWKGAIGLLKMVFSMDFRSLFAKLVNFAQFTISFDFGASDASLTQQVEALKLGVSSQLGGFAGQAAGWFLGGALPGFAIFAFNEVAGLNVLKEVGQEALEELADSLYALTQAIWRLKSRELFIRSFKNVRKWLKQPNNPFYAFLPESLKKAWTEGKSWRIADRVELAVESIQDAQLEAFAEEALDEFGDSFLEAGYVVAGGLDKYVAEQKRKKTEQVLEVTPNREYPNEKFLLAGHETELRATLPLILANHEIIDHRDIGVVSAVDPTQ